MEEQRKSQPSESDHEPAPEEKSPEPPKRDPIKFKEMLQAAMRAKLAKKEAEKQQKIDVEALKKDLTADIDSKIKILLQYHLESKP
jgi:hypothetical protein